jgi:hypothetical protein
VNRCSDKRSKDVVEQIAIGTLAMYSKSADREFMYDPNSAMKVRIDVRVR